MNGPRSGQILAEAAAIAAAAQAAIDGWIQDEHGVDEELGAGGACDLVAEAMSSVLSERFPDIEHAPQWSEVTTHTSIIARLADGVHEIDVPHSVYETGFGYKWRKIADARIAAGDVVVTLLDRDPDAYPTYVEE